MNKAKELKKIKDQFKEMVAYVIDTKNIEVIDNYTETFLQIHKDGIAKLERECDERMNHKTLEDVKEGLNKLPKYSHSLESIETIGYMVRLSDVEKFLEREKL